MDDLLKTFLDAVKGGDWLLVALLLNMGVVWAAQRFGKLLWSWLGTGLGKILLSFAMAGLTGFSAALIAGQDLSWKLGLDLLVVAAGSSGLYSWLKKWVERSDA